MKLLVHLPIYITMYLVYQGINNINKRQNIHLMIKSSVKSKYFRLTQNVNSIVVEFGGLDCKGNYIEDVNCTGIIPVQTKNESEKCFSMLFS